jgi:uncharacterized protein YggE
MRSKLALLVPLLALILVLSACGPASSNTSPRVLSVSGTGTVYLTPDIAYLNVGVHTEDAAIAAAVDSNNTRAQALVDALVSLGIASQDIQTSNFSVWSTEAYNDVGTPYTKYVVDNTVYITVRDLGQLGALLNTVVSAGANNINSLMFDVADKTAALAEARQVAMANANSLASELAQTAGVSVGEIQSISYSDYTPSPYYGMGGGGASVPNATVPIQPGQFEVTVTVSVTYGIK